MSEFYEGQQFVGIDLHRRRSVLVRMTETGELLETVRILNDRDVLAEVMSRAGESPEVVLEATYGWYWAADALAELGATVHLAHPLGVKGFSYRRVKNDQRDAADLADLLRMGRLPHAWIAPPETRELRELVRHRAKLVAMRSRCKAEVHAVLAKGGIWVPMTDLFGIEGNMLLDKVTTAAPYQQRIASLRRFVEAFDAEIELCTREQASAIDDNRPAHRCANRGPVHLPVDRPLNGDHCSVRAPSRHSTVGTTTRSGRTSRAFLPAPGPSARRSAPLARSLAASLRAGHDPGAGGRDR